MAWYVKDDLDELVGIDEFGYIYTVEFRDSELDRMGRKRGQPK